MIRRALGPIALTSLTLALTLSPILSGALAHAAAPLSGVRPESGAFALVVHAGEPLVVIGNTLGENMRSGAPAALPGAMKSVLRGVRLNRLPARARAWLGRSIRLFDDRGLVCEARVRELGVWTRIDDTIRNVDAQGEPEPALEHDALVGRVTAVSGDCSKARWARDAALPAPAIFTRAASTPAALGREAEAALRALPVYRRIQRRFVLETSAPRTKAWDAQEGATTQTTLFVDPALRPAFISVAVTAGQGCGEFGATLWATWAVNKDGSLTLRSPDAESPAYPHEPAAILSFGANEALRTLADGVLFRLGKKEIAREKTLDLPFNGCGC